MRAVGTFILGTIIAYCVILFGWIALSDLFGFGDMDGGKIMSIAFAVAPAGALIAGIALAIITRKRAPPSAELR